MLANYNDNNFELKSPGGLFPLTRHLSYRLTPALLALPISPNQITTASLVAGLLGATLFMYSGSLLQIAGGLLITLSYVLDNCDGEVARVKKLSSEFGARLDDVADSVVDTWFFVALGYGTADETGESIWLWLGLIAAAGAIIDFVVEQVKESRLKDQAGVKTREQYAHDPKRPEDFIDWLIYIFHELSRSDFCLIILVLALFDLTWVLLPLAAIGAQIFWITDLFDKARGYHT